MPTTQPNAATGTEEPHEIPRLQDRPEGRPPSDATRVLPTPPRPTARPDEPFIFPSPDVARRAARLSATLPGADDRAARSVEEIDAICDTHRLGESDRGVLLWRECVQWTAVMRLLCGRQGWTPDRVRSLSPSGLLAALEAS